MWRGVVIGSCLTKAQGREGYLFFNFVTAAELAWFHNFFRHLQYAKPNHRSSTKNASFIVFNVTCVMRVMWAIRADTYPHVWMDLNKKASSVYKYYNEQHGEVPKDLLRRFSILKKCRNKFDCLVNEMLFIRDLKPTPNVQSDSIRAKVFI